MLEEIEEKLAKELLFIDDPPEERPWLNSDKKSLCWVVLRMAETCDGMLLHGEGLDRPESIRTSCPTGNKSIVAALCYRIKHVCSLMKVMNKDRMFRPGEMLKVLMIFKERTGASEG